MAIDREQYRKSVLENIERFGFHATSVMGSEPGEVSYSYSTGIHETINKSDIIIFGLSPSVSHAVIGIYYDRLKAGELFEPGNEYSGFLKGYPVIFASVPEAKIDEHMLCIPWLYLGRQHEAYQLLYPDDDGKWPWDGSADESFRQLQPVVGSLHNKFL